MPPTSEDRWLAHGSPTRDLELVRAVLAGDELARRRLYERMRCVPRMVSGLNRRRGGVLSAEDVEDLAQDVLVILWRKLDQFHGQATLEMWAGRTVYLETMNRLRSRERASRALGRRVEGADMELEQAAPDLDELERAERAERLERRLDALSEGAAAAIRLKHFGGLTFEEIGARLGESTNTVKTRYYRGLARLRETLERRGEEEEA